MKRRSFLKILASVFTAGLIAPSLILPQQVPSYEYFTCPQLDKLWEQAIVELGEESLISMNKSYRGRK